MKEKKLNKIPKNINVLAILLLIIGLVLEAYVFSLGIKNILENTKYTTISANVVGYSDLDNNTSEEVLEYEVENKVYKKVLINKKNEPNGLGSTVMIKYQNNNPENIIWMDTNMHILPTISGTLFLILGLYLFYKSNKKTL